MRFLLFPALIALLLRASSATMVLSLFFGMWMIWKRDERSLQARTFCAAMVVPISGVFPDLVTGLIVLTILCLDLSSPVSFSRDLSAPGKTSVGWAIPAVVLTGSWAVTRMVAEFDSAPFLQLFAGQDGPGSGGLFNIFRWLRGGPPGFYGALEDCIRYLVIASLWSVLGGERGLTFTRGLLVGGVLAAVSALAEWCVPEVFALVRPSHPYWKGIGRMTGFATDPNALGIVLGSLIPLAVFTGFRCSWIVVVVLFLGGFYSGSRSFFILPGVTLAYLAFPRRRGWGLCIRLGLGVLLLVCFLTLGAHVLPRLPVGLVRLRESFDVTRIAQTFESRTLFTRLCVEAFKLSPLFGVGLGRFEEYVVPLAYSLRLGTGVWRDSALSTYLEILCELGLLGVLVFLGVLLSLRRAEGSRPVYRALGVAFLIALLVIPSTNFAEGVAVAGLLLAQTVVPRWRANYWIIGAALAISAAIPFHYMPRAVYGFYPWETHERGFIRWTAVESRGAFGCRDEVVLTLLNGSPITQDVEVRTEHGSTLHTIAKNQIFSVKLPCHNDQATFLLNVSPGFTPAKYGFIGDNRLLGVRQLVAEPIP